MVTQKREAGPAPAEQPTEQPTEPPTEQPTEPPTEQPTERFQGRCPVVGLGASAGGLEAFEHFFAAMPVDSGMGFVLIQHLDPSRSSLLADILQRSTRMPVVEAMDGMRVEPNRVHVIPPNRDMVIDHGSLRLSPPAEPRGQRMPIDAFLRSLADDSGEDAVGIVLSGTGTDGTQGLRAVFAAGGLCLVQDPATTRFDSMPQSAARYANRVLPVEQMAQALAEGMQPLLRQARAAGKVASGVALGKVLTLLRVGTGHDFSQYKKSTVERRVERRMVHHRLGSVDDYVDLLKRDPAEVQALFRELLINVTSFFRDPPAFGLLQADVLPALLAGKPEGQPLRVWVAGCATGEEAYSLAILLREWMDQQQREVKVQMYATDLDDEAIAAARAGLYPPNIAQDLSPERLRRFFLKEPGGYRIKKEVREMVVFAVQSVIKDPPFTRMDLVSCRNLMIYLEAELQERLIQVFHYALRPGGVLFLSPSESTGEHAELFEAIDRKWKLYRSRAAPDANRALATAGSLPWAGEGGAVRPADTEVRSRLARVPELARRALLQAFAPAAVVTDLQGNVLYVHGETGRFLRPAPGQPTHQLVDLAREGLEIELREALHRAADQGLPTLNRSLRAKGDTGTVGLSLSVRPLHDPEGGSSLLLVSFQELPEVAVQSPARRPRRGSAAEATIIETLQREIGQARQSMKVMVEEQQAANEDLKSTNEELQSTNEELQSSNEELETSREELQSVNEELVTVNAELQNKIDQMAHMQDDLRNLLDNIRLGIIFLDRELRIRRYTQEAARLYRLVPTDVGRPLADIRCDLLGSDMVSEAQTVIDSLQPVEREARTQGGTWYLARIQPYRTVDNAIDGVVLTFADVTDRVQALAVRQARDVAEAIVDSVHQPLVVLDGQFKVISANRAYYDRFGGSAKEAAGQSVFEVNQRRWDQPAVHELLATALPHEGGLERRVLPAAAGDAGPWAISGRRILGPAPRNELVLLSIEPHTG